MTNLDKTFAAASDPDAALAAEAFDTIKKNDMAAFERLANVQGFDPDARDNDGQTLLMAAAKAEQETAVTILLQRGAQPDLTGPNAETAMLLTMSQGNANIAKILIEADALCHETTPEAARRHGHYALAQSLEEGDLHKLYLKAQHKRKLCELNKKKRHHHKDALEAIIESATAENPSADAEQTTFFTKFLPQDSKKAEDKPVEPGMFNAAMGRVAGFAKYALSPFFGKAD